MEVKQTKERQLGKQLHPLLSVLAGILLLTSAQCFSHTRANVPPVVKQQEPGYLSVHHKSFLKKSR